MATALKGVRVLELTTMITGPYAGMMLADLGAEVIKIENPENGDPFRSFRGGLYSPHFCGYNRNKRSMTLNLRSREGRKILLKLVETADVLLENFRPGVMARLSLDLDTLHAANPRLIYCAVTGFGADGPYRMRPAYDAVAQSLSGVSSLFLDPENPRITGPTIADNITGFHACYGILGALFERERTGVARRVEVNMLESAISFIPDPFASYTQLGLVPEPYTRVGASQSYASRCADGKLLAIHLSSPPKFWEGLLAALGKPELGRDPRFETREGRIENYHELADVLASIFETAPRDHWMERLEENGVPFAPVNTIPEVFDDPQVRHLGTFFSAEHPTEGTVTGIKRPVRYDGARDDEMAPPPALGEHTEEILGELGYDGKAVKKLREASVV